MSMTQCRNKPQAHEIRGPSWMHRMAKIRDWIGGSRVKVRGNGHHVNVRQARLIRSHILVEGEDNTLEIRSGTRLFDSMIVIRGNGHHVEIGESCILGRLTLVLQSSFCRAVIGKRTTSGSVNIDLGEPNVHLRIGQDCMISHRVEVMCGDGHSLDDAGGGGRLNHAGNVEIGDHVWLAAEAAILKGASVGDHSTVGFRSVVTSAIPSNSLAVGIPARVIRSGVTWTRDLPWQNLEGAF